MSTLKLHFKSPLADFEPFNLYELLHLKFFSRISNIFETGALVANFILSLINFNKKVADHDNLGKNLKRKLAQF